MPRRIFLTGGAGFVGGAVARLLRIMGDDVIAVVRDPAAAGPLRDIGVKVVAGDLSSNWAIREAMAGSDAVIHAAGSYRVGIPMSERPAMYEANVAVAERVLDAAIGLGVARIVDISTVNAFGNTRGLVADETYERDVAQGFVSYYDETKFLAHQAARRRIEAGAPIVIVMPGTVYGRGDQSVAGTVLEAAFNGRLPYYGPADAGLSPTYIDDLAAGIVAAMDRARVGESYVMAGENMHLSEAIETVARAGGHRPPRIRIPSTLLRVAGRLLPNGGRLAGQPPNLREIVSASVGVTYWASSAKAESELGYRSRPLPAGAVAAYGRL
jgi:nucleoside-diphosphate-sugar epimerase